MNKNQIAALEMRRKSPIPVLRLIKIENGIARISDFETNYLTKVDVDDGLYSIEGNQLVQAEPRGEEFPILELGEKIQEIELEKNTLLPFFNYTDKKSIHKYAKCIHFNSIDEKLNIVATNGHIMRSKSFPIEFDGQCSALIENIMKNVLKRMAKTSLKISFYEKHVGFESADEQVIVEKLDETYPDYQSVIPSQQYFEVFTIPTKRLKQLTSENKTASDDSEISHILFKDETIRFCSGHKDGEIAHKVEDNGGTMMPSAHDCCLIMGMDSNKFWINPKLLQKILEGKEMTFYYDNEPKYDRPFIIGVK